MSDTPRTDAARLHEYDPSVEVAQLCSKLERELAEMTRERNNLIERYHGQMLVDKIMNCLDE